MFMQHKHKFVAGMKYVTLSVAFGVNNELSFSIIPLFFKAFPPNNWYLITLKLFQSMMESYMVWVK